MALAPQQLLADPDWFPYHIDKNGGFRFVQLTREDHRAATFLVDEYLPGLPPGEVLPFEAVRDVAGRPSAPVHFIFHSAFCCSTLLARALDVPGVSMGLKEPASLQDIADFSAAGASRETVSALVSVLMPLFARPFSPGETSIVKPSNVANLLIPDLLQQLPRSRALLLYAPLPTFLRSVAKKNMLGRIWARKLFLRLRRELRIDFGFSTDELMVQTDLQVAALVWLMHHAQFGRIVQRFGAERVRTLDSASFLAAKQPTLMALARLFDLDLDEAAAARIVDGPAFSTNSKSHAASFDESVRAAEHDRIGAVFQDEIEKCGLWIEQVARHAGVALDPGAPLLS